MASSSDLLNPETPAPYDSAPDDSAPDCSAPDDSAPYDSAPDDSAPDDSASDDSASDDSASDDSAPDCTADRVQVAVSVCRSVTDELVEAMGRLIPQLSSSRPPPGRPELEEIADSPASTLFVARSDGSIVGVLTLVVFRIPTGVRSRIEDVVVDESVRGKRIGERLTVAALNRARLMGALNTDLTSRPSRQAANRLYTRMGFQRRDSNIYRYKV